MTTLIDILLSATQVNLFRDCQRKWGFKYLDGIKPPTSAGALLGTEVQDTQLDPWLATGKQFDYSRPSGEIALALSPLLPKPGTAGMQLRRKFWMPSPRETFAYQGELDIYAISSGIVPGLALETNPLLAPLIGDVKTTRDLKYAKTSEDLATDVQAMLYTTAIMFEENVNIVDLVWFSVRTRKPHRAQRAHLRVFGDQVAEQFEKIDLTGAEITRIKTERPKVSELPPNVRMCDQYGGCPYRNICNLSPPQFAAGWNEEEKKIMGDPNTNAFFASLKKNIAAPPTTLETPVVVTPRAFAPGGAYADVASAAKLVPPAPEKLPDWATAPVDPLHTRHQALIVQNLSVAQAAQQTAINPPESSLPSAPPVGAAAAASTEVPAKRGRKLKAEAGLTIVEATQRGELPSDEEVVKLASLMRANGIKRLQFMSGQVYEIELSP